MGAVIELEIGAGPTPGTYCRARRALARGRRTVRDDHARHRRRPRGLPQIESSILASSVSARRVMSTRESAVQSIGVRLFDAVFAGRIGEVYRASARGRVGARV